MPVHTKKTNSKDKVLKNRDPETTGHEWDGIQEFNNPDPFWLRGMFYAMLFFVLGYCFFIHLGLLVILMEFLIGHLMMSLQILRKRLSRFEQNIKQILMLHLFQKLWVIQSYCLLL